MKKVIVLCSMIVALGFVTGCPSGDTSAKTDPPANAAPNAETPADPAPNAETPADPEA